MFVLKFEQNEVQLLQVVLASANLDMAQSNLRGVLWQSIQNQLQPQMPSPEVAAAVKQALTPEGDKAA